MVAFPLTSLGVWGHVGKVVKSKEQDCFMAVLDFYMINVMKYIDLNVLDWPKTGIPVQLFNLFRFF